jgi:hypothetical protein
MYAKKCGRPPEWSAEYLERSRAFIPAQASVEPIVDVIDFPANIAALATASDVPSGFQVFGGDAIFSDPHQIAAFDESVREIRRTLDDQMPAR